MALEEKVSGEQAKPFVIANEVYDRKKFTGHMGKLGDLEEYNAAVVENKGNIGALKDLASLIAEHLPGGASREGAQRNINAMLADPQRALIAADGLLGADYVALAQYVERNRDEILDETTAEQLYALVNSVPLYKTGDKEHDKVVDLVAKVKQINEAIKNGQDLTSIVEKEIKASSEKLPDEIQQYVGVYSQEVRQQFAVYHIQKIQKEFEGLFRGQDKKLDKEALRKFLEDNYKAVEDYMEDTVKDIEPDEKKREKARAKLWDKNLKHQYVALAKALNATASKEQKMDDDPEKETIKAEAKKRKMAA